MQPQLTISSTSDLQKAVKSDLNLDVEWNIICQRFDLNSYIPKKYHQKLVKGIAASTTVRNITVDEFDDDEESDRGESDVSWLWTALKLTKSLTTLKFVNFKSLDIVGELADALKQNSTVTKICIKFSKFTPNSTKKLLDALKQNSTITKLDLLEVKTRETVELWRDYLVETTTLRSLALCKAYISAERAKILFEGLKKNSSITALSLDSNPLGEGLSELINIVLSKPYLTKLNINYIEAKTPQGVEAICKLLKANHLERLEICQSFRKEDKEAHDKLMEALQYDRTLKDFTLCVFLDEAQSVKLGDWIQKSNSIERLRIYRCHFDESASKAIGNAIKNHMSLKHLEFINGIFSGADSLDWIFDGLKTNTSMREIYISPANEFLLSTSNIERICSMLKTNDSLIKFSYYLPDPVPSELIDLLLNALSVNKTIEEFSMNTRRLRELDKLVKKNKLHKEELQRDWWILSHNIARAMRHVSFAVFPSEVWLLILSHMRYRGITSFETIARKVFRKYRLL